MSTPVFKTWARLSPAQQYALACLHWEGRAPYGCRIQTLRKLELLGLVDAALAITEAGRRRVVSERLYVGLATLGQAAPAMSPLEAWLEEAMRVGSILRPSRQHYARCDRIYGELSTHWIRAELDAGILERALDLFRAARYAEIPSGHGFRRYFSRASMGAIIVELANRLERVRSGRAFLPARAKGPRFDVALIPDRALERLIQLHPDLELVDAMRAERRRRQAVRP